VPPEDSFHVWGRVCTAVDPGADCFCGWYFFWLTVMNPNGLLTVSFIAPINAFATLLLRRLADSIFN